MRITKKQTIVAATAAAAIFILGGTGVAMAATGGAPSTPTTPTTPTTVITPTDTSAPADTLVDVSEVGDATEGSDGADQGPDANLTEPGHQDANEANDVAQAQG